MSQVDCPREHEVVSLVLSNQWSTCDEELKAHATTCEVCRDAVMVASLLGEDEEQARRDVHVPAAGQVWWRAAIRARVEAIHAAERPMTWLHGLAGAIVVGLAVSLIGIAWPWIEGAASWISSKTSVNPFSPETVELATSLVQRSAPFALAALAFVILAPIAVYLATNDE